MDAWPKSVGAITLFVEDLAAAKRFYGEAFGLPLKFEDDDSAVFDFGNTLINLLKTSAAHELIDPATVASPESGARLQLTIGVDDVDARCAELTRNGVELLSSATGGQDLVRRPWVASSNTCAATSRLAR